MKAGFAYLHAYDYSAPEAGSEAVANHKEWSPPSPEKVIEIYLPR